MPLTNQLAPRMSRAELETYAEWQALTPRQQMFLATYIQSGLDFGTYDAQLAVQTAYNMDDKMATIFKYELLANRKIKRVMDLHFGRTAEDSQQADLMKAISKALCKDPALSLSKTLRAAIKLYEKQIGVKILKPAPRKPAKKSERSK